MLWHRKTVFQNMEPDRNYYYDINRRYLLVIGQWPYQKQKDRLLCFVSFILLESTLIVAQVMFTVTKNKSVLLISRGKTSLANHCDKFEKGKNFCVNLCHFTFSKCLSLSHKRNNATIFFLGGKIFRMRKHTVYLWNVTSSYAGNHNFGENIHIST